MKIINIQKDSLAENIGLHLGDRLLKINGKRVTDEIDYRFRITDEHVLLDLEIDGKMDQVDIKKDYDVDLGVEFEEFKIRKCANDCVFCFVDQNPDGMRQGMYFRDGDYRLSYLHGHYITLTNMGQKELNRIVEQRLSPLYISVHTTDVALRQKLLLYGKEDNLLDKLKFLTENDIELHSQVVLIPGLNDGKYLLKTIDDMFSFYPMMNTMTVVPVGLTKHRKGLMPLETVSSDYAKKFIDYIFDISDRYPNAEQNPFMLLSDEWFILAKQSIPNSDYYGELDLVENGCGQVRQFIDDFEIDKLKFPTSFTQPVHFTLATGDLAYPIMKEHIMPTLDSIQNLHVDLVSISNDFYGDMVTVAGLLTGQDIIKQLQDKELGTDVWCSHRILDDNQERTLDNMTLADMSDSLNVNVSISNDSILNILENYSHV